MGYKRYQPPEMLKDLVQFFWEYEDDFTGTNAYQQVVSASASPKLAFQYKGRMSIGESTGNKQQLFRSGLQGQSATYGRIHSGEVTGIFGVYLFPHALPVIFGIPAAAITDLNIEISALLGAQGAELEERIMLCSSTRDRLDVMNSYLSSKLNLLTTEEQLMANVIKNVAMGNRDLNVMELAAYMGLSKKQVERKFQKFTGFAPAQFVRITRFENSIFSAYREAKSLTTLAHEMGYYDQSHFIKNFREFSGQSPREYFAHDLSVLIAD